MFHVQQCKDKDKSGHVKRQCRVCKSDYMRVRRASGLRQADNKFNNRCKLHSGYNAKKEVYIAVRKGYLPRVTNQRCVDCGNQAQVYDHRDYNLPLDVSPVCKSCNAYRGKAVGFLNDAH